MSEEGDKNTETANGTDENGGPESAREAVAGTDDMKDRLQRTLAEFQNFRRHTEKRVQDARRFSQRDLIADFLPIVDNFGAALQALDKGQDAQTVIVGVRMIHDMLIKTLTDRGVRPIAAEVGTVFDPEWHEALSRRETTEIAANTVVEVIQKGYTMDGLVVRHARVVVAVPPVTAPAKADVEGDGGPNTGES